MASSQAEGSISLALKQGSGGGFGFSWLHDASGTGTLRNTNGRAKKLGNASNSILADYDAVNQVLTIQNPGTSPDPLVHDALNTAYARVDANSLRFTGGVLSVATGVHGGGYIDYQYTESGTTHTGTFYFKNVAETGKGLNGTSPNSGRVVGDVIDLAVWGNNWMYTDGKSATSLNDEWGFLASLYGSRFSAADFDVEADRDLANTAAHKRLWIDLRASGVNTPEPLSLLVWGGLFGLVGLRRWSRLNLPAWC